MWIKDCFPAEALKFSTLYAVYLERNIWFSQFREKNKSRVGRPLCQFRDSFLRPRKADNGQQENNPRPIIPFSNALIEWPSRRFPPMGYCLFAELTAI
jgi:hypothetical protein